MSKCGDKWECDSGECITAGYFCDGTDEYGFGVGWNADCDDGSDEKWEVCCDLGYIDVGYDDDFCSSQSDQSDYADNNCDAS